MKKNKIIFWTATIIVALWEAVMPMVTWISAPEYMTFGTKPLGYPDYFAYSLAIAKVYTLSLHDALPIWKSVV